MSTRVAWATLQPTETEHVVSVMLCRENPSARRVRPAPGDRGIDVITVTSAGWVVDQIKYFHARLTSDQKHQVKKSFEDLRTYAAEEGARIAAWHLVLPLDHSNTEREWFDELTSDAGYPCEWRGLTYVEGLAAKYSDVIDYYLRDGRERLQAHVAELTEVIRLGRFVERGGDREGQPLAPAEIESGLTGLYAALNAHDPHYRYSFSVDAECPELHDEPFLVAAVQRRSSGVACVTFRIYAKFNVEEAARERQPININVTLQLPSAGPEMEALRNFNDFGAPVMIEDREGHRIELTADLPGGLGGAFRGGRLFLGPNRYDNDQPYRLRLQILDEADREISTCKLDMEPMTRGVSGVRVAGVEEHGVFTLEMRIDPVTQQVTMSLTGKDLTGKHPSEVLPGLRVAAAFHPPNKWRFASPYGLIDHPGDPIPGALDISWGIVLPVIEALATIQERTTEQIVIPDETTIRSTGVQLVRLAHLLRQGSVVAQWNDVEVPEDMAGVPTGGDSQPGPASFQEPCVVRLNDRNVVLGSIRYELASARVEPAPPAEDGVVRVRLIPADDRTVRIVYEPTPSA